MLLFALALGLPKVFGFLALLALARGRWAALREAGLEGRLARGVAFLGSTYFLFCGLLG
jgi:hypothetical protein